MSEPTVSPRNKFTCALCRGSGFQSGRLRCLACRGQGTVELAGTVAPCSVCRGKGKALNSSLLPCLGCRGVGVVEKSPSGRNLTDSPRERVRVMAQRLRWTKEATEKKTKEIKKRLKPFKPLVKAVQKETSRLEKFMDIVKKEWEALWKHSTSNH